MSNEVQVTTFLLKAHKSYNLLLTVAGDPVDHLSWSPWTFWILLYLLGFTDNDTVQMQYKSFT